MRTLKRNGSSKQQEDLVAESLLASGFEQASRRDIDQLETLPRGSFARQSKVSANNCDRPVRLRDGRLLAIECKVSNRAINSRKRLNKEVGANRAHWDRVFGEQVITAAVIAGVYSLSNLVLAQDQGIWIIWAHDLRPLTEFLQFATAG